MEINAPASFVPCQAIDRVDEEGKSKGVLFGCDVWGW